MTHINCVHKQSLFAYAISTKFPLVGLYIGIVTYVTLMILYIFMGKCSRFQYSSLYRASNAQQSLCICAYMHILARTFVARIHKVWM